MMRVDGPHADRIRVYDVPRMLSEPLLVLRVPRVMSMQTQTQLHDE